MSEDRPFNQTKKREAEFFNPPNRLKQKVGSGGLSDEILQKAQELLENNAVDFAPLAEMYLEALMKGVELAQNPPPTIDNEYIIARMIYPSMQLKANGGMFHYPLVTSVSDRFISFLEVIEEPDSDVIEIAAAFHTTIRAIVFGGIKGDGGKRGKELLKALEDACTRYFNKKPLDL